MSASYVPRHARADVSTGSRFFRYHQSNPGGHTIRERYTGIWDNVIVEATDAEHANRRALGIGIYFDGVSRGLDCDCCGNRWHPQWDDAEGDEVPSVYDESVMVLDNSHASYAHPAGFVHYMDDSVLPFVFVD